MTDDRVSPPPEASADRLKRLKAQALALLSPAEQTVQGLPPEQQALLENLRIYQVELELQNEELRRAQQDADIARRRYQALFAQLPLPALVIDPKGVVHDGNAQARALLPEPAGASGNSTPLLRAFTPTDRARLLRVLHETGSGQQTVLRALQWRQAGHEPQVFDAHLIGLTIDYRLDPHVLLLLVNRSAEAARAQDQRLFARMLDASDNLIYAIDRQGHFVLANQALLSALGQSHDAVMGRTRNAVFPPVQAIAHAASDQQVLREGTALSFEESLHSMGQRRELVLLTQKFPLFDADGGVSGVGVISTDVAAIKAQQREALLSETVFQTSDEAIVITDAQARIVRVNPAFTRQSGFTMASVLGANPKILKSGQHDAAFYQALWDTLLREGHWSGEVTNRRAKGQYYTVLLSISRVTDAQGTLLYYIGVSTNITLRRQLQSEANHNAELLRAALDAVGEAFVLYDDQDRLAVCNQKYRELYASSADLLQIGNRFEDIIRIGAERGQYAQAQGRIAQWVAERLALHQQPESSCTQVLDSGRVVQVRERRMANGYTVGFRFDVTELVRATQEAQAASQAKSRFLATMSHEIRTPMNGILGMAQLLQQPGLGDMQRQTYLSTLLTSSHSLLHLLNDILDLSRVESGKLTLERAPLQADQLLDEVCALFAGAAQAQGLALQGQWLGEPAPTVLGDALRLRQMLSNLVGNAIKFTQQGQIVVSAQRLAPEGDDPRVTLEFAVQDTGMGLSEAVQARLFQPFSQADDSTTRRFGGTGLGLSIVKSLAQAMDGAVGVHSVLGQGARFWFTVRLALADVQPTSPPPPAAHPQDSAPQTPLSGQVLVVEDNPVNALVAQTMLTQFGVGVVLAGDGQQALDVIQKTPVRPDLILMDLHMPVMDGYEATRNLRALEARHAWPRLPIIALTADAYAEDHQHCLDAGMDDHLSKPVTLERLHAVLRRWLPQQPSTVLPAAPLPTPTETGVATVDAPELWRAAQPVLALLDEHRFDALEAFEALRGQWQGTALSPGLEALAPQLKRLQFDAVARGLRQLLPPQMAPGPA
ncbi:MAG: hypothetical protein Fur007_11550 [Rhodoferax sp.]